MAVSPATTPSPETPLPPSSSTSSSPTAADFPDSTTPTPTPTTAPASIIRTPLGLSTTRADPVGGHPHPSRGILRPGYNHAQVEDLGLVGIHGEIRGRKEEEREGTVAVVVKEMKRVLRE
ncbi:hypothetical protein HDU96_001670 [Phlyctochytrium bullatum]|nr:hypothetical protein HDU96_001670 [Phlyctochytrium bullatum]